MTSRDYNRARQSSTHGENARARQTTQTGIRLECFDIVISQRFASPEPSAVRI